MNSQYWPLITEAQLQDQLKLRNSMLQKKTAATGFSRDLHLEMNIEKISFKIYITS